MSGIFDKDIFDRPMEIEPNAEVIKNGAKVYLLETTNPPPLEDIPIVRLGQRLFVWDEPGCPDTYRFSLDGQEYRIEKESIRLLNT